MMIGVCVFGHRKAGGGEGKGLGLREAEFNVEKGHGSLGECCLVVLMAARVMWETMGMVPGQC